ncbi:3-(3-hydroxyphenyl)propionate hydroxylase [Actinomycetospora sp. NBRC 106375]|uniref:FAD-dependent monooxygenase n=1 Tax=Actinomycetospora sp. NBRC 106375 TaxID=3032207 RepID=UPI0024A25741|nr:FAD-dependent monooxygenase [Actinomycetospora sp. NBRC 106375]GLZ50178.1 3-(3-hydroxyphenyl)propionate hydroxylase [Actinomycetospora sp. NBRC 106375]
MELVSEEPDTVLVVGAGPVGLTAAAELARQGARVRLVDALTGPSGEFRAITVHPRTQEHLAAMGVLDRIEAHAQEITAVEFHVRGTAEPAVRLTTGHVDSRFRRILDVPQVDTESVLREVVTGHGVAIEYGWRVDDLVPDGGGVTVTLAGPGGTEHRRYGWVVGADGAHSAVRRAVGTHLEGEFAGEHSVLADVDVDTELPPTALRLFVDPRGGGGVFPLAGRRAKIAVRVGTPDPGTSPTVEQVQRLVDEQMGGHWRLGTAHWLTYFESRHAQVPRYRHGRVLLAGDAAHIHPPAAGQGMNTGIQDAVNLAWKLALVSSGRADASLLDTYDGERHPVGAAVVAGTSRLNGLLAADGPGALLRDLGLHLLGHLPAVGDRLMATMTETAVSYRAEGERTTSHAVVGDHAPDVTDLRTATGEPTHLDVLLRRPGHLLLVVGAGETDLERLRDVLGALGTVVPVVSSSPAPSEALIDPAGDVGRRYGLGDHGFALVRPDGYLACVSRALDPRPLHEHRRIHGLDARREMV